MNERTVVIHFGSAARNGVHHRSVLKEVVFGGRKLQEVSRELFRSGGLQPAKET